MTRVLRIVIALAILCPAITHAQQFPTPAPAPGQWAPCTYNSETFSAGAIVCIGDKRGIQCKQDDPTKPGTWFTDSNNNAPMNDGCKWPTIDETR